MKKKTKKILAVAAVATAIGLLAACGNANKKAVETTPKPTEKPEPTSTPASATAAPEESQNEAAGDAQEDERVPQTAEEAANDQVTIQNEIDSIQGLIDEELYDDALMQARALLTKNLTQADKEIVNGYIDRINEIRGEGLTD